MTPESEIARIMAWLDSDQRLTPEQEAEALAAVRAPRAPRQPELALAPPNEPAAGS
jgi:hypothetical protein